MSGPFRRRWAALVLCALLPVLLAACAFPAGAGKKAPKVKEYLRVVTESGEYTDSLGNTTRYVYELPEAHEPKGKLHDLIEDRLWKLTKLLKKEAEARENGLSLTVESVHTECAMNGQVLSFVCRVSYLTDLVEYYTFNYDVRDQAELSLKELCAFGSLSVGEFKALAAEKAEEYLRERYASDPALEECCRETEERINGSGYEPSLYLSSGGELVWAADIDTPWGRVNTELVLAKGPDAA